MQTFYGGLRNSKGELVFSGQAYGQPDAGAREHAGRAGRRSRSTRSASSVSRTPTTTGGSSISIAICRSIDAAAGFVDAVNPDLRAFEAHGGKLLLYAGWRDTGITPENTVLYYESVREEMGPEQDDWMRLFLAPGMGHCRGGPGVDTFDTLTALEQWRERDARAEPDAGDGPRVGPRAADLRVSRPTRSTTARAT